MFMEMANMYRILTRNMNISHALRDRDLDLEIILKGFLNKEDWWWKIDSADSEQ